VQAAEAIRQRYGGEVLRGIRRDAGAGGACFVEKVAARFGGVDICVTNAGGPPAKGFLAASNEEWQRAVELNFLSTVYFAQEVIRTCREKVGTDRDHYFDHDQAAGGGSCAFEFRACGGVGLVKSLANEFGRDGFWSTTLVRVYGTDRLKDLAASRSKASGKTQQEIFEDGLLTRR